MRTAEKEKKMHSAKVQQGQSLSACKRALAGITASEAMRAIREDTRWSPPGGPACCCSLGNKYVCLVGVGQIERLEESERAHNRFLRLPLPTLLHCHRLYHDEPAAPVLSSEIFDVVLTRAGQHDGLYHPDDRKYSKTLNGESQ